MIRAFAGIALPGPVVGALVAEIVRSLKCNSL